MLSNLGNAIAFAFAYFTIIYLTGLGGLFSERSGIVNIGLEGLLIVGTVTGAYGTTHFTQLYGQPWGPILGLLFGALCGMAYSLVHALATITFRVDQIVSGVVINLAALGIAEFLSEIFFQQPTQSDPGAPRLHHLAIPLLSKLPAGLGAAFTGMSPVVILALLMVFPATFVLYRTRFGLRLRSAGENPEATRSLGVRVAPLRYVGVMISGFLAGLAGAFLAFEVNDHWLEGQTLGLGFISLAALILSNWSPVRLMLIAFLFGFAQAVPYWLNNAPIIRLLPQTFVSMTPYVVTIVAIAGFVGKVRPPAAAGRAYLGGEL
jgi:general nucleoside transport system permease protein